MHDAHEFLRNLALVLATAGITTLVFQRLRQPVVFGYLLAGMLVGPHVPVPLADGGNLINWREKLEGGAEVVEVSEDGWPALVAAGKLHYLGGWPDEVALTRILMRACAAEGLECDPLPEPPPLASGLAGTLPQPPAAATPSTIINEA